MPDADGCHARDLIVPLFFNDNTELHNLIRRRLILFYLTSSFHLSFIEEYAGGLLMALQKPDLREAFVPSSVERFGGTVLLA
jgi:hypothetical protein